MIRFSIAICTYNRATLLSGTLQSLQKVVGIDQADVEVVVINNASTDNTPAVLDEFSSRLPLRHFYEAQQGHCFARNRAVQEARGQIVVWTDDDVELDSQWLAAYREATVAEQHVFWGGPIIPRFLAPPPTWIRKNWTRLAGCYAERQLGSTPRLLTAECLPYGANFAVRHSHARQFGFNTQLGRKADNLVGEDERDFLLRLLASGCSGMWVPTATLYHLIPQERLRLDYISRYFAGQASVAWQRGIAPEMSARELKQAIGHHRLWWQITRWCCPSRIWLDHWIKKAMFQQWLVLHDGPG